MSREFKLAKYFSHTFSYMFLLTGFSSDGASSFLSVMREKTFNNVIDSDVPEEFRGFFNGNWNLENSLMLNDSYHLLVKLIWRLMRKTMNIGNSVASKTHVLEVLNVYGKMETGISQSIILDDKDSMDYERADKLTRESLIELLSAPEHVATRFYLKLATHVRIALIDISVSPEERLKRLWCATFMSRLWRASAAKTRTLLNDFMTPNAYMCLEVAAHNMIKFLVKCRDLGKPSLFIPYDTNSQPCENTFRILRSMGTTKYTVTTFSVAEVLHKARRISKVQDIVAEVDPTFHEFKTHSSQRKNDKRSYFVPTTLPSNIVIKNIISSALLEALTEIQPLGIESPEQDGESIVFPQLPGGFFSSAELDLNPDLDLAEEEALDDVDIVPNIAQDTAQQTVYSEKELEKFEADHYLADIISTDLKDDNSEPFAPRCFFKVQGKVNYIKKSTVLWSLCKQFSRICRDRLGRFINKKHQAIKKADFVFIGHFVKMMWQGADEFFLVLGFKNIETGVEITKSYMPLNSKQGERHDSVGVIATLYQQRLVDGKSILEYVKPVPAPIPFKDFIRHVEHDELLNLFGGG